MMNQGECPKCGKRLLHVRIETIVGQNNGNDDVRCLSYSCIHCNAVLHIQIDPRAKRRRRTVGAGVERAV